MFPKSAILLIVTASEAKIMKRVDKCFEQVRSFEGQLSKFLLTSLTQPSIGEIISSATLPGHSVTNSGVG